MINIFRDSVGTISVRSVIKSPRTLALIGTDTFCTLIETTSIHKCQAVINYKLGSKKTSGHDFWGCGSGHSSRNSGHKYLQLDTIATTREGRPTSRLDMIPRSRQKYANGNIVGTPSAWREVVTVGIGTYGGFWQEAGSGCLCMSGP